MYQIHYQEHKCCDQNKTKKLIHFVSSYLTIFVLNSIHRMSQASFVQQNIIIFFDTFLAAEFLFTSFAFLCPLKLSTRKKYIFDFNPKNCLIGNLAVFYFILLTTNVFELS